MVEKTYVRDPYVRDHTLESIKKTNADILMSKHLKESYISAH